MLLTAYRRGCLDSRGISANEAVVVVLDSFRRPAEPAKVDESSFVQTLKENPHGSLRICDESMVRLLVEEERKSSSEGGWMSSCSIAKIGNFAIVDDDI